MTSSMNVFRGSRFQRGHGLGSLFSSLLRGALPLLKTGAKYIGKRALSTGMKTAEDIMRGENPKEAFKKRLLMEGEDMLNDVSRFTKKRKRRNRNMKGRGKSTTKPKKRKRVGSKKNTIKRLKRKTLNKKHGNKKKTKRAKRKKRCSSNSSLLF